MPAKLTQDVAIQRMKEKDSEGLINWDKSLESFVYENQKARFKLFDSKYEWYETSYEDFIRGRRHIYRSYGSPQERFDELVNLDIEGFIDWEKTKERFKYISSHKHVELFDKEHGGTRFHPVILDKVQDTQKEIVKVLT